MSKFEERTGANKLFLKIIEGSFRQSVPAKTEGAIVREHKGKIYTEIEYPPVFGKITDVAFEQNEWEGKKFNSLVLTMDENEDTGKIPVITVGVDSKYAQDLMHRLPNIKLDEDVRIRPFAFTPEGEDKEVTGIEIMQRDSMDKFTKKITSYFYKKDGERNVAINGFPVREIPWDEQTEEEREIYKIKRKGFLVNFIKENVISKFENVGLNQKPPQSYEEEQERNTAKDPLEDEFDPSKIPF